MTADGRPSEWTLSTGPRGVLLRVCSWGPPSDPPLVILHGFLEQGAAWDQVARRLSRRVHAPDQRGHGRSGHIGSGGFYHFWDYVSDVDALVQQLGGKVDLLGHSMGGTVACQFAGTRPECVRRLILVEGLGPPDMTDTVLDRARRFLTDRRRGPRHGALEGVEQGVSRVLKYNPGIPREVAELMVSRTTRPLSDGGVVWTWDPLHRARSPVPFQAALFAKFLENIESPTLCVRGGASRFQVEDEGDRFARLHDARSEVIPDAGHLVHHDAPEALAALIEEHLA